MATWRASEQDTQKDGHSGVKDRKGTPLGTGHSPRDASALSSLSGTFT